VSLAGRPLSIEASAAAEVRRRPAQNFCFAALALVAALALPARAEIQKSGSQVFTGRFLLGIHPVGGQIRFEGLSVAGYKFSADFSGKIKETDKLTLWLGGGLAYALGTYGFAFGNHGLSLNAFLTLTFEKLVKIPLVPFVRAGIGGDILLYSSTAGNLAGGAFTFRVGTGVHYYIIKALGLGVETHFTFGPGFYPSAITPGGGVGTNTAFFGNWDFLAGLRAHF
jgi:hypothetical protein